MRTRKKVVQAAKQRRKYRMGGSAFERAAERRKLDRTTTNTTPTPKKGALAKKTTNTPGTVVAEPTNVSRTEQKIMTNAAIDTNEQGRSYEGYENYDPSKDPNYVPPARRNFQDEQDTADERRLRAARTTTAAETLATGELDDNLKLADISEADGTKLDSTIEGEDTTIDAADFTEATAGQAAAPTATTVTEGTATKAELPSGFSIAKLNDDLTSGVSRKIFSEDQFWDSHNYIIKKC